MELIEKVFLLRKVDLLRGARSAQLGLLGSIAEEIEVGANDHLIESGQTTDAMYVVVRGSVEITGPDGHVVVAGPETPFGTWALIDSDPNPLDARVLEPSRLLRITRRDFQELVTDYPDLATGILQGLARRVRSLVG